MLVKGEHRVRLEIEGSGDNITGRTSVELEIMVEKENDRDKDSSINLTYLYMVLAILLLLAILVEVIIFVVKRERSTEDGVDLSGARNDLEKLSSVLVGSEEHESGSTEE
jgi:hypothetical protein